MLFPGSIGDVTGCSRKVFCDCTGLTIGYSGEKNIGKGRDLDDLERKKCGKMEGYGDKRDNYM